MAVRVGLSARGDSGSYQINNDGRVGNLYAYPEDSLSGESIVFWRDLSIAGLIPGNYGGSGDLNLLATTADLTAGDIGAYLPKSKLNSGLYVIAMSTGYAEPCSAGFCFVLYPVFSTDNQARYPQVTSDITAAQVYAMDSKMDDGLPQSGRFFGSTREYGNAIYNFQGDCLADSNTRYNTIYGTPDCVLSLLYRTR